MTAANGRLPQQARVAGRCLVCRHETLRLVEGHLVCTWPHCVDQTAVTRVLEGRSGPVPRPGPEPYGRLRRAVQRAGDALRPP